MFKSTHLEVNIIYKIKKVGDDKIQLCYHSMSMTGCKIHDRSIQVKLYPFLSYPESCSQSDSSICFRLVLLNEY